MTLFCLGGVSGSGKTRLRQQHPVLRQLPCVDIADVYERAEQQYGTDLDWREALQQFVEEVDALLEAGAQSLVLEAFFRPGGEQRSRVQRLAARHGQQAVFIWCHAPREACEKRVLAQAGDSPARRRARLRFVASVDDAMFRRRRGEDAERVLCHGAGQHAQSSSGGGGGGEEEEEDKGCMGGAGLLQRDSNARCCCCEDLGAPPVLVRRQGLLLAPRQSRLCCAALPAAVL